MGNSNLGLDSVIQFDINLGFLARKFILCSFLLLYSGVQKIMNCTHWFASQAFSRKGQSLCKTLLTKLGICHIRTILKWNLKLCYRFIQNHYLHKMYKWTVISQPALEQNTVDTKQQKNGKKIREYNSIVFNTAILHITILLHIDTSLMQHLQVTCTYLQKVNVSPDFLAVKWKKSHQASHLCWSLLVKEGIHPDWGIHPDGD